MSSIQPSVSTLLIHLYKSRAHMNSPINAVVISKNSANTGVKTALVCEMCMCACVRVCVGVHACVCIEVSGRTMTNKSISTG